MNKKILSNKSFRINPELYLRTYVFDKTNSDLDTVDCIVAKFIKSIIDMKNPPRSEIVLWRGEYKNSMGMDMWVLGLPSSYNFQTFDKLYRAIDGKYDDSGSYRRIDTGCKPYVLISDGQIWLFDNRSPFGCKLDLQISDEKFNAYTIPYEFSSKKSLKTRSYSISFADLAEINEELYSSINTIGQQMTSRTMDNWPILHEFFPLFLYLNHGEIDYRILKHICETVFRVPVYEISMKAHGMAVIKPIWTKTDESYSLIDHKLLISINKNLNSGEKLITLGHELGHFIFHYNLMSAFSMVFSNIQDDADIEDHIAKFTTQYFNEDHYLFTEMSADRCASYFALSPWTDSGLEQMAAITFTSPGTAYTSDLQRLHLLNHLLYPHSHPITWANSSEQAEHVSRERLKLISQSYDPMLPIKERMKWMIFNRTNEHVIQKILEFEYSLNDFIMRLLSVSEGQYETGTDRASKLLKRVTIDQVFNQIQTEDFWEPVVVEPKDDIKAVGYIGVIPCFYETEYYAEMRWTQWTTPTGSALGTLPDLLQYVEERKMGLMLYGISPLDLYLRRHYTKIGEQ